MKNLLILLACLFSLNSFSKSVEVDVISAEFGVEDHLQNRSLCVTVVRLPENGELLGLVEGIYDCFYARNAKRSKDHKIYIELNDLKPFEMTELLDHLQSMDSQLKFLFSEGE